jgi:poly(3-hydroxybutyrate) depolymerase
LVKPETISDIGLMTVEGAKDDISGVGQTQAAHDLCPAIPEDLRSLYVHPDVGHYGVFNGRRFQEDIYPEVRAFILKIEAGAIAAEALLAAG